MAKIDIVRKAAVKAGRKFGLKNVQVEPARGNAKYCVSFEQNGTPHTVHFGHKAYEDFHDHKDRLRQQRFIRRSSGITNAQGQLTRDLPSTPNFWSMRALWAY